ncbi:MAG TPA: RNA pyrophosphohydrolase [Alphaproteobacteria bacterium]|nr:RNA pyrophosphohydrolase [Alphaproteobacteria bacterium]
MTAAPLPPEFAHLPYRPCVGMMLLNARGEAFVARRIDMPSEAWQMPQGGIDEGEAPEVAVFREMREEIGTDKAEILGESATWHDYDLPTELLGKIWGGRYRGQRQKWFVLRFTGRDRDINILTEEPEFLAWKWAPVSQLPDLIVPFKRELYQKIVGEFAPYAERLAAETGAR